MSDASYTTNGHVGKKVLSGPELAAWTRNAGLMTKLCLAAAIAAGEVELRGPTLPQISKMLGLKSKQVRAIAPLTPEQRAALTATRRLKGAKMSNGMLDDLVEQVGAARLWAAIDRATLPKPNGGMNGNGGYHAA